MSGTTGSQEVAWRCLSCYSSNSPKHRMCTACKKWRDLDWSCVMCGYKNFAKRDTCKECGAGHVPEFRESGSFQEVQGSQHSSQPSYQAPLGAPEPLYQGAHGPEPPYSEDNLWMCGMCNTENTPLRILCFECSGHRDRVEVRNRAAESRRAGGGALGYPAPTPRVKIEGDMISESSPWRGSPPPWRETPPWVSPHIRDHPREAPPEDRPEDRTKDWACSDCGNRNFAKRQECNRCKKPRAEVEDKTVDYSDQVAVPVKRRSESLPRRSVERPMPRQNRQSSMPRQERQSMTPRPEDLSNDWVCGKCHINCFAKKTECFRCGKPRSEVEDRNADIRAFEKSRPDRPAPSFPRPQQLNVSGHELRINPHCWSSSRNVPDSWNFSRQPPEKKRRKWVDEDKSNDWNCKICKINNFAKRKNCYSCNKKRDECEDIASDQHETEEEREQSETE